MFASIAPCCYSSPLNPSPPSFAPSPRREIRMLEPYPRADAPRTESRLRGERRVATITSSCVRGRDSGLDTRNPPSPPPFASCQLYWWSSCYIVPRREPAARLLMKLSSRSATVSTLRKRGAHSLELEWSLTSWAWFCSNHHHLHPVKIHRKSPPPHLLTATY
jgi:hypothetical protein